MKYETFAYLCEIYGMMHKFYSGITVQDCSKIYVVNKINIEKNNVIIIKFTYLFYLKLIVHTS